ncbi:MAG TPA: hypothetical protein VNQ73_16695 [Ilumatobacter sp.]|nr:hypothetical protein [Ilumatobacter sp.]
MRDRRTLIVPHLDGDVLHETAPVEELLLWLRPDAADDAAALDPDGLFAAGAEAIGVLRSALARAVPIGLYAPDGRWEHVEVQVFDVPAAAVDDYAAAVASLTDARGGLADDLEEYARSVGTTSTALVGTADRFRALTAVGFGSERRVLAAPLRRAVQGGERVALTEAENASFLRLCEGLVAAWHENDSLTRWMYGLGFTRPSASTPTRTRATAARPLPVRREGFWR